MEFGSMWGDSVYACMAALGASAAVAKDLHHLSSLRSSGLCFGLLTQP
jgi:hypothetical protein